MTTIKTTCAECGDIQLTSDDLALRLDTEGAGAYSFMCPDCLRIQSRTATPRVVSVLLAAGVSYQLLRTDPITETEIREFAEALERVDDPFRLLAS